MIKLSDWLYFLKSLWLKRVWWPIVGVFANRRLKDEHGKVRDEAEEQLARIIYETGIRPDAVSATTFRGGPCFVVKHKDAMEAFIHRSYTQAADEAIKWLKLQGDEITPEHQEGAQQLNRQQRRTFKKRHAKKIHAQGYKKGRKKVRRVH